MKNRILLLLFVCGSFFSLVGQGYNSLRIIDPDRPWRWVNANIKDVILTVDPRGAFFEYGLYMTIEDTESTSSFGDQLEVVLDFSLPAEAAVVDSWLWIEDEVVQADLLDRWTANQIYEDIVDRRQDPSILFKQSATQYELRIFPLNRGSERRIKIAWLQPLEWGDEQAFGTLPSELLRTSIIPPQLTLRVFNSGGWTNPQLLATNGLNFVPGYDLELGGNYMEIENLDLAAYNNNQLRLDAPFQDDLLVTTSENEGAYYYQMVYQPDIPAEHIPIRRQLVLIDYQLGNTSISRADILDELRLTLKENLEETDEFNIILPAFPFAPLNEEWVTATDSNIDNIFDELSEEDIPTISNLPVLLERGLQYLNDQSNSANMVLISNSGAFNTLSSANALFNEIQPLFANQDIRISIAYQPISQVGGFSANGRYYFGNTYLYELIARQSDGLFNEQITNTLADLRQDLRQMLALGPNIFGGSDVQTQMENGFCYNRRELTGSNPLIGSPTIVEVGQFVGGPTFRASFFGVLNGEVFEVESEATMMMQDNQAYRAFTAANIQDEENQPQTNNLITGIIAQSLAARVLSRYTAFLALEPGQGGVICIDCEDGSGGGVVATNEIVLEDLIEMTASPNPIQNVATIRINTAIDLDYQKAICRIIDTNGKLYHEFPAFDIVGDKSYDLEWDATGMPSGVYMIQLVTADGVLTVKVLKL